MSLMRSLTVPTGKVDWQPPSWMTATNAWTPLPLQLGDLAVDRRRLVDEMHPVGGAGGHDRRRGDRGGADERHRHAADLLSRCTACSSGLPVLSLITLASTTGKFSRSNVIDGSIVDCPPLTCRSISGTPRSNSWLPSVPDVDAHRVERVERRLVPQQRRGRRARPRPCRRPRRSPCRADRSPRRCLRYVASVAMPPAASLRRCTDRCRSARCSVRLPCTSLMASSCPVEYRPPPLMIDVSTLPWACNGGLKPPSTASVGARSTARHAADRPDVVDVRPAGDERGVHVDVVLEVDVVGQVAVLAEELRRRDQRADRVAVELVRHLGHHDDVAGAGRVERVAARRRRPAGPW